MSTDSIHTIVFEHSPDAIVVTNGERIIETVNPAFTALFGYSQQEVAGQGTRILYANAGDYERIGRQHAEEGLKQPVRHYNILYSRKDGSSFHAETTARMMLGADGRYGGHVGIIRDVSARVRLKELLRSLVALSARAQDDSAAIVRQFLSLGREYFDLDAGVVSHISGDSLKVRYLAGVAEGMTEGQVRPAGLSCCDAIFSAGGARGVAHPACGESAALPCFLEEGIETYIGCPLKVAGKAYGTLSFFSPAPRPVPFSEDDRALVAFLGEWLGGFLDQSEQKAELERMSEDLKRNAENFQSLYRQAPAMLHSTDQEGRLLEVSDMWLTETGYSREDVLGRPVMDFYTPESKEEIRALLPDFWSGRRLVKNEPRSLVRKDGSIIDTEISGIVADAGNHGGKRSMTVLVDVTERNRARAQLELKNAELERLSGELARTAGKFEKLYRETPAMLHSVDPEGRLVEVSDYWLMKLGYRRREEVLGQPVVNFHPPEERERARRCIAEFWRTGKPAQNRGYHFLRKDGTRFEAELSVIAGKPKDDLQARSLAVSFDVTDRNKAWRELEVKNDELLRLNEELDTFASVASHDLQEPLRKILKFSEVLEEELPAGLSDDGAYAVNVMRQAVQRMQTLISDLLGYARSANAIIETGPVDLGHVMDRVREDLSLAIAEADASIVASGPLPVISGDAQQVRQLFQNLIGNAVKYRDSARPCRVAVVAEPCGLAWRVSVRDNGIGFSPEAAETIFLPFRRLQPRSPSSGSGLGLTICGRIAERHGWSLRAKGAPGKGATFTLEIPVAALPDQYLNAAGGGAAGIGATQSIV